MTGMLKGLATARLLLPYSGRYIECRPASRRVAGPAAFWQPALYVRPLRKLSSS